MTNIIKALIWASAILGLAGLVAMGWVNKEAARPFFLAMPVLAVLTMNNAKCCNIFKRART